MSTKKKKKSLLKNVKDLQATEKFKSLSVLERGELYYNMLLHSKNLSRGALTDRIGKSFDGERDLYASAGYKDKLDFEDYYARYRRQDISKKVVNFWADETWAKFPTVFDTEEAENSTFETEFKKLKDKIGLQEYFKRVDRLSGIGEFAVLFLGFADGLDFDKPCVNGRELLYVTPYKQNNITIDKYVSDITSPDYGKPEMYTIKMLDPLTKSKKQMKVHYSRILHVAENPEEVDFIGTPRLEDVYNRLQDIETTVAGATEMFWKGGFTGTIYEIDKEFDITTDEIEDIKGSISDFEHDLKRYLLTKGITGKQLNTSVESPKEHVETELDLIAGATGIPKRILIGSEEGKLAGEQDSKHLMGRVDNRRQTFANTVILRPFIDRMIELGILTSPKAEEYTIQWEDVDVDSVAEKTDVALKITKVLSSYVQDGIGNLIPPEYFLTKVLNYSQLEAKNILEAMAKSYMEEDTIEEVTQPVVTEDTTPTEETQ